LDDRTADGAEPLLAIADLAGGEWPGRARSALVTLAGDKSADEDSLGLKVLKDCKAIFDDRDVDRLSSADLVAALIALEESPWAEINRGKPLTVRKLAWLLNPYDIASGTVRFPDAPIGEPPTAKGYYRVAFEDSWNRLLSPPPPQSTFSNVTTSQANAGAASLHFSIRHTEELVTDEKREIVNTDGPCDAVTDESTVSGGGAIGDDYTDEEAATF
jgi:putative DNA primase/helicase